MSEQEQPSDERPPQRTPIDKNSTVTVGFGLLILAANLYLSDRFGKLETSAAVRDAKTEAFVINVTERLDATGVRLSSIEDSLKSNSQAEAVTRLEGMYQELSLEMRTIQASLLEKKD